MRWRLPAAAAVMVLVLGTEGAQALDVQVREYPLPALSFPHDVAPAADGGAWYTAQASGRLGWLDASTGTTRTVALGLLSHPHGVILGPDGAPWLTMEGSNEIVRVDPRTNAVTRYALPAAAAKADLNTATFDEHGVLWFTGQAGWFGRLDPRTGAVEAWPSPRGPGPYGMNARPGGPVYFVSLAGNFLGIVDPLTAALTVVDPPRPATGPRRVWLDSKGTAWVTGWTSGTLLRFDPSTKSFTEIAVPGPHPQPYAVYVDEEDRVWISDFGANAIHVYDPAAAAFTTIPIPSRDAQVRQLSGRRGEVWGAESGANRLLVLRFRG